jgi:hypothetical protein
MTVSTIRIDRSTDFTPPSPRSGRVMLAWYVDGGHKSFGDDERSFTMAETPEIRVEGHHNTDRNPADG